MGKKEVRYALKLTEDAAEGRFAKAYEDGKHGKGSFMSECISAGYMLKEVGLLDTLRLLDEDPDYKALTPLEKRSRLLSVLPLPSAPQKGSDSPSATPEPEKPRPRLGMKSSAGLTGS